MVKAASVLYDAINAMLLNEFLKEHRQVAEQQATLTELKKHFQTANARQQEEIRLLRSQLAEQAVQLQQVSAQVEMNKEARPLVSK